MIESRSMHEKIPRREFIGDLLKTAAAAAILMTASCKSQGSSSSLPEKTETPNLDEKGLTINVDVGSPKEVKLLGLNYYPDGHTSFLKNADGVRVWIAGGPRGYLITGKDLENLEPQARMIEFVPSNQEDFERNYAAPGSVIPGKNPNELLMFYHGEFHPNPSSSFPFNAAIGLAISRDEGLTWEKQGQIIEGKNNQKAIDRVYGAG